jgi:hypothetical protein
MPTPQKAAFLRPALAPGLLGAIALVAGVVLVDSTIFIGFRYVTAILAAIVFVFAYRGRGWIYLPFLAAIVVLWNPVLARGARVGSQHRDGSPPLSLARQSVRRLQSADRCLGSLPGLHGSSRR